MSGNLLTELDTRLTIELSRAFKEVGNWGSVEIYIQNGKVTQITKRAIKKTNCKVNNGA